MRTIYNGRFVHLLCIREIAIPSIIGVSKALLGSSVVTVVTGRKYRNNATFIVIGNYFPFIRLRNINLVTDILQIFTKLSHSWKTKYCTAMFVKMLLL